MQGTALTWLLAHNLNLDDTQPFYAELQWPGGEGWLEATGTFTGATARLNVICQPVPLYNGPPVSTAIVSLPYSPHPDFPAGISAPGVFRFNSPPSIMKIDTPFGGISPGDGINSFMLRVVSLDRTAF